LVFRAFCSLLTVVQSCYNRTITINGVSKAYAMTGWRIGYCGGPKESSRRWRRSQGQSTSNASSISQRAAVAALNGDQECVSRMNEAFKARHDYVVHALNCLPGISCLRARARSTPSPTSPERSPASAVRRQRIRQSCWLNEGGVAVVRRSGFGAPGHIRISFACSMQTLEKAMERLSRVLEVGRPVAQTA